MRSCTAILHLNKNSWSRQALIFAAELYWKLRAPNGSARCPVKEDAACREYAWLKTLVHSDVCTQVCEQMQSCSFAVHVNIILYKTFKMALGEAVPAATPPMNSGIGPRQLQEDMVERQQGHVLETFPTTAWSRGTKTIGSTSQGITYQAWTSAHNHFLFPSKVATTQKARMLMTGPTVRSDLRYLLTFLTPVSAPQRGSGLREALEEERQAYS